MYNEYSLKIIKKKEARLNFWTVMKDKNYIHNIFDRMQFSRRYPGGCLFELDHGSWDFICDLNIFHKVVK